MQIDFLFRLPQFPIIGNFDNWLILANSVAEFEHRLDPVELKPDTHYYLVDSIGNEWVFSSDKQYVMPTLKRKWSKKKIVQMYNDSQNCQSIGVKYSERSLSIKHFATVFADIVDLVERCGKKHGCKRSPHPDILDFPTGKVNAIV